LITASIVELILVVCISLVFYGVGPPWPATMPAGQFMLYLGCVFFIQSLMRDFWLLLKKRRDDQVKDKIVKPVICIESVVGMSIVFVGACLLFSPLHWFVEPGQIGSSFAVFGVLLFGFWLKDLVLQFRPLRIYRNPDHTNIIVGMG
jgi:hypothetical protein